MSAVTFPLLGIARLRMGSDGEGVTSLVAEGPPSEEGGLSFMRIL